MTKPTRVYIKGDVIVEWYDDRCIHCHLCHEGLPTVFDPASKPWVNMDGAPLEQIAQQVGKCPSGALRLGDSP